MLDLAPDHGLGRFDERDRIEGESVEFHERVRRAFLDLAADDPDHYLVVDARLPVKVIAAAVAERTPHCYAGRSDDPPEDVASSIVPPAHAPGDPEMTVWDSLVGQARVVESLQAAVAGRGMSHAWLFTGPPGSGRSNAAVALAAALQCERGGCDECHECHTVQAGTHADVTVVRTEKLSIGVDEVRDLVRRAALSPVGRRWQVMIVEDADRLTEQACNALLKAIEEPTERTVWMLCAPTVDDVLPTIRSRCRLVTLATPTADDVAAFLVRKDGVADGLAAYAARASQGHIGRARALARDEATRNRRREVVTIPARLTSLGACMTAAANLVEVTKEEADDHLAARRAREGRPRRGVRRGRARSSPPRVRARAGRPRAGAEDAGQAPPARRRRPRADGPGVGLPRRDRRGDRRGRSTGQRGDPRRRRRGRPRLDARAQPAPDRLDLRGPRADARVQRPGRRSPSRA